MNYKNLFSCKGRVAVIVGGKGLLGREISRGLSSFGAVVYVADISEKGTFDVPTSKKIKSMYIDITKPDLVKESLLKIYKKAGYIDILVNCAYPHTTDWGLKFEEISFASWKENINNHLGGYFVCCQIAAELMKRRKSGVIINFSSIYGFVAPHFNVYEKTDMTMPAAYSAIKGGIIAFSRYLATYYAAYNIRVNVISPGGILNNQNPIFVKKYEKNTPLGRMGFPSDIVGAVIYLASDASKYVTGHNLVVDGGWTAW